MSGTEKPILLDLPVPIQTQRLVIRPIMANDGNLINDAILESFDQFQEFLPWAKENPPSPEESEITAREMYADYILRNQMSCVVFENNILVGMCGFVAFKWKIPLGEIGYWTRKSAQGKGYTQEAVNALTYYGFQKIGLRKIIIRCDEENLASGQVAQKCGYTLESKTFGDILKPITNQMRTCLNYARFDTNNLNIKDVSW